MPTITWRFRREETMENQTEPVTQADSGKLIRPIAANFHGDGRVEVFGEGGVRMPEYEKSHTECLRLLSKDGIHWTQICKFGVPNAEALQSDGWSHKEPIKKKFPIEPLGMVVIVRKIASDISAGGVYVPTNDGQFAMIVGEVVAVGLGVYATDGTVLKPMVKLGDTVIAPLGAAKQITFEVQRHLKERGVSQEDLDQLYVIREEHLAARFV